VLTHNYTGYPMIRQARAMVANGDLGAIRVVQVEYAQDWLSTDLESSGQKQAGWRTDPARTGAGGSTGDIGTHAYNLASFVTGLKLESLAADLQSFVPGRRVDDNGHVLLRFAGGARGMLWCSQVAAGNENALKLRVYGEKAGLEWAQENPNYLWHMPLGEPRRLLTRGGAGAGPEAARVTRIPSGHPEGYLEGFATIYAEAARAIRARQAGQPIPADVVYPGVDDGVAGVAFVDACVRSSARDGAWITL
jgi:predicted dehydrogenase